MDYCKLGTSALGVSRIGFGCMSLKEDGADNHYLLHMAVDKGVNFFDTADLYGNGSNESMLGKALKEKRKDLVIATKVGNQLKEDGSGWIWNPRKDYILSAVEGSLQRLQTDYIDLYQLHGGTLDDNIDETIEAFELLQQQGKIRFYGISSIRPNVIRSYVYRSAISSVMMQYSLLDRRPEESSLDLLANHGIGVLARGSLAGGLLVDKPPVNYLNYAAEQVQQSLEAVTAVSLNRRSNTSTALQFVLQQPAITSAIVGIRTAEQLDAAVQAISAAPLDKEDIAILRTCIPLNYYSQHR